MKWYKSLLSKVIKGLVFFVVPLVLLIFIVSKAIKIIQEILGPIEKHLPSGHFFGVGVITIISVLLLLLICFLAGLLTRIKVVKSFVSSIEDNILVMMPGYAMMKSRMSEFVIDDSEKWQVVMIDADESGVFEIGVMADSKQGEYCIVFFPEPPDCRSGGMKLVLASLIKKVDMPVGKFFKMIRQYGEGIEEWKNFIE